MICVKQAIIVEGRYDKIRLSNIVDTAIICTNGFSIYKDADKQELIKSLAEKTGIIILTDSDSAGFQIRSFIRSIVKKGEVLNAVTPDIFGKERRKLQPSKQGKLGVEGIPDELIIEALKNCGAVIDGEAPEKHEDPLTRTDLMEQVWNYGYVGDDVRTVDVTVRRLREKIEDDPAAPTLILTRRGVGYYFSAES